MILENSSAVTLDELINQTLIVSLHSFPSFLLLPAEIIMAER